jgi:hypothetical protein
MYKEELWVILLVGQGDLSCGAKHMHITNLFLNCFIQVVIFLWNHCQLDKNSECLDIG